MKCIFFGDTHLGRRDAARHAFVRDFIEKACTGSDMVFILGDLFEFYHGYDNYIYPWYRSIVDALRELAAAGTAVYHIEGNHEFDMGSFFSSHTGLICARRLVIEIDGKKVFIAHGDEMGDAILSKILKSPPTYKVMNGLGPALTWRIAMVCRLFLSERRRVYREKVRDRFRVYAKNKLDEGFDAVILAHTHMSDFVEYGTDKTKKVYLNTGGLIEELTYGHYTTSDGFSIRTCKPAEG
ncbi:MAG TPA: UDP-2,3-diacylglucosamine diphosphatase [Syntrophorhabdales bacterium]|nr:UDP-2,3-diacylglucosamine diphosphatase [Syntrophorhabdales bacterium]